jgi:hypothetical protein
MRYRRCGGGSLLRDETFVLVVAAALIAVVGVFGFGTFSRDIEAHTTNLSASPSSQVIGEEVTVFVGFLDDEGHDPSISLSSGVWDSASPAACISGVGTNVVTIDDEGCDVGTTSSFFSAVLTTTCSEPGVVTATSSLHTGTSPNFTSFTCGELRNSETRRATLKGASPKDGNGKATLASVGDSLILTVEARGLTPLTGHHIRLTNFGPTCSFGSGFTTTDAKGNFSATAVFSASSFESFCGTPAGVQVVESTPSNIILKGDLNK